jgi:phospholipid N-methyltransferase
MNDKTREVLENSEVSGNNVKLPDVQLSRAEYIDVKKTLDGIGGKWKSGKTQAFVFAHDPKPLLDDILGGKKINLKKDFQFFATPSKLANRLVGLAEIESHHTILEPSAGQGAIIEAIHNLIGNITVSYYELMPQNRDILNKKNLSLNYIGEDFLEDDEKIKFDRIIANPPFTKNQDIEHFMKMYECLNENGILVCITSTSWKRGSQKKQLAFKEFLENNNAEIIEIKEGEFKESGTSVATLIVKIAKSEKMKNNVSLCSDEVDETPSFDELFAELEELGFIDAKKSILGA